MCATDFINSKRVDVDFAGCLTPQVVRDQKLADGIGLINSGHWFSSAHVEIGGGASFAYLHTGLKIWCSDHFKFVVPHFRTLLY